MGVEFRPASDVPLRRLYGQLLGQVAVEVVEALGRHPVARHEDDEAQLRLAVLDALADRRADDVRPVGGLFELEALVVAREHLLDHVAAEDVRVAHDVLLERVERLLHVRQVDDGVLALPIPVLDADLRPPAAAKADVHLDAAHLRADELPVRENRVGVFRNDDEPAVGLREKVPVLLGMGVEFRGLLREAHAEIVHVAAEAALLDVALDGGREETERAVHVAHALLQRGGRRALVLGADAVADVVDAEREKAEEELLDRAGVEMSRLHVRDARTQRAPFAGLLEPLRVLVGNARNAFEHVRVELVPVADRRSAHRFVPLFGCPQGLHPTRLKVTRNGTGKQPDSAPPRRGAARRRKDGYQPPSASRGAASFDHSEVPLMSVVRFSRTTAVSRRLCTKRGFTIPTLLQAYAVETFFLPNQSGFPTSCRFSRRETTRDRAPRGGVRTPPRRRSRLPSMMVVQDLNSRSIWPATSAPRSSL